MSGKGDFWTFINDTNDILDFIIFTEVKFSYPNPTSSSSGENTGR